MKALVMNEIYQYSRALARNLSEFFFIDHTHITGKEILEFSDIKQINFLMMKNIFERWQFEKSQWQKSPYFAYQHPEIQKSLQQLQNILSNHIEINKENFFALLLEAIQDTLVLVLNPEFFFQNEISKLEQTRLQVSDFEGIRRFILFNKNIFQKFMLEINNFPSLSPTETSKILSHICQTETLDNIDEYLKKFNALMPIDLEKMVSNPPKKQVSPQNNLQHKEPAKNQPQNILPKNHLQNPEFSQKISPENDLSTKNIFKTQILASLPKNEEQEIDFLPNTLHEKFVRNTNAIPTILEKLENTENSKKILPINDRFMYANALFGGYTLDFNEAMDKLDLANGQQETENLLYNVYAKKYGWDLEKEETKNFVKYVLGKK